MYLAFPLEGTRGIPRLVRVVCSLHHLKGTQRIPSSARVLCSQSHSEGTRRIPSSERVVCSPQRIPSAISALEVNLHLSRSNHLLIGSSLTPNMNNRSWMHPEL
ncbi:hypothetical protein ElyMa_000391800 [Elysia marginata]|uniref:Uncharacterized protein n=1 Tax=Elysia marginata TaxID=1093978 RepID=A0AAV4FIR2_9GAST|nr:hypothetical protein ElyMa_000391800 [Elysia marginata]